MNEVCTICEHHFGLSDNLIYEDDKHHYFKCISCKTYSKKYITDDLYYASLDYSSHYNWHHKGLTIKTYYELNRFLGRFKQHGNRLLDFGGGIGSSLIAARQLGFVCHLCEINSWARKVAAEKHNIKNIWTNLDEIKQRDLKFDVIFSSHTLEHVSNPLEILRNFHSLLEVNGYLILILPFLDFYLTYSKFLPRKLRAYLTKLYFIDDHNFLWSREAISNLLSRLTFNDIRIYPAFILNRIYLFDDIEKMTAKRVRMCYEILFNLLYLLRISSSMTIVCKKQ